MIVMKRTVFNIQKDKDIIIKDRNICKNRYNIIKKIYKNNTFTKNDSIEKKKVVMNNNKKEGEIVDSVIKNNRTLIMGFSN